MQNAQIKEFEINISIKLNTYMLKFLKTKEIAL